MRQRRSQQRPKAAALHVAQLVGVGWPGAGRLAARGQGKGQAGGLQAEHLGGQLEERSDQGLCCLLHQVPSAAGGGAATAAAGAAGAAAGSPCAASRLVQLQQEVGRGRQGGVPVGLLRTT